VGREVILAAMEQAAMERAEGPSVETLLGEIMALWMIFLNVMAYIGQGRELTTEKMQALIDRADAEKFRRGSRDGRRASGPEETAARKTQRRREVVIPFLSAPVLLPARKKCDGKMGGVCPDHDARLFVAVCRKASMVVSRATCFRRFHLLPQCCVVCKEVSRGSCAGRRAASFVLPRMYPCIPPILFLLPSFLITDLWTNRRRKLVCGLERGQLVLRHCSRIMNEASQLLLFLAHKSPYHPAPRTIRTGCAWRGQPAIVAMRTYLRR